MHVNKKNQTAPLIANIKISHANNEASCDERKYATDNKRSVATDRRIDRRCNRLTYNAHTH